MLMDSFWMGDGQMMNFSLPCKALGLWKFCILKDQRGFVMKRPKILALLLSITTCSLFGLGTACAATGNFPADFVSVRRAMIISFEPESLPFGAPPGSFADYVRNSASASY